MSGHHKVEIHGVVLLNKPAGITSNQALQRVKKLYLAAKAGHTGSLDPMATGLLPICLGQATKVCEYLLGADKKYEAVIKLGEITDTCDADGEVIECSPVEVANTDMQKVLGQFRGDIQQIPPMYSALKINGQPMYKLARKGEIIDRPARALTVYSLTAEQIDDVHYRLQVHCSSGFYVRSLAHDIGQALGCGAHLVALHRLQSKGISVDQAVNLQQLEDKQFRQSAILPIDVLLQDLPGLEITDDQAESLLHGRITAAGGLRGDGLCRLYRPDSSLFGLGRVLDDKTLKTDKIFVCHS